MALAQALDTGYTGQAGDHSSQRHQDYSHDNTAVVVESELEARQARLVKRAVVRDRENIDIKRGGGRTGYGKQPRSRRPITEL